MSLSQWFLLDAHQMGRRLHLGIRDKDGKGFHDRNARDIVAIRYREDGEAEAGVWGDDGTLTSAAELTGGEFEVIRVLDANEKTSVERIRIVGSKVGKTALGAAGKAVGA